MCAGLAHAYPLLLKNLQNPNRSWLSVLLGLKQISVGMSVGASFDGWRTCNVCCGNIATAAESSLLSVLFANYEGIRQRKGQSSLADAQSYPLPFPGRLVTLHHPTPAQMKQPQRPQLPSMTLRLLTTTRLRQQHRLRQQTYTHTVPFRAETPEEHKQAKENVGKRQAAQAHWPAPYLMLYSNGSTMRRAFTKPSFWVSSRSFSRVQVTFWPFGKLGNRDPPNVWGFSCRSLQISWRCWIPLSYVGNPVFFF